MAKEICFTAKSVYFVAKSIGIITKSVYFAAKSIDFAAEKGYLQARKSGCLQYKSFILRGLGKKPSKRQQNDFTTKTLFKAADRKYRKNKRQFE